jgi:hypothetical protein
LQRFTPVARDEARQRGVGGLRRTLAPAAFLMPTRHVACRPARPAGAHLEAFLMARCGHLPVASTLLPGTAAMRFDDRTIQPELPELFPPGQRVINGRSLDISKRAVQTHFARGFGYALAVAQRQHEGPMVQKSDANYTHDGHIVNGPLPPGADRPGRVYQRLVDTLDAQGYVVDLRTIVVAGRARIIYRKRRPAALRFAAANTSVEILAPADAFSPDELARIAAMASAMGVDFGALDVLRDVHDGRIYVVDVNNTPGGLPSPLTAEQREQILTTLEPAWRALVEWSRGR